MLTRKSVSALIVESDAIAAAVSNLKAYVKILPVNEAHELKGLVKLLARAHRSMQAEARRQLGVLEKGKQ